MTLIIQGNRLYSRSIRPIQNRQYQFIRRDFFSLTNRITQFLFHRHNFQKKIIRLGGERHLFLYHDNNLAHFFHDFFFPFYCDWRKRKVPILLSLNKNQFLEDFFKALFKESDLVFIDFDQCYEVENITLSKEGRDLKIHQDYLEICKEIRDQIFKKLGIRTNRSIHLLYGRNELERKRLLGIETQFFQQHQIFSTPLSTLNFRELVSLLSQTKTFTYMVGAGVFYLLFLDRSVKVLEINPNENNSWAQMFGMSNYCLHTVYVSMNTLATQYPAQGGKGLDDDVIFDTDLAKELIQLIR